MIERAVCVDSIDYSQVEGNRILPFRFTLDLENSILSPGPGEKQRFCYLIEGVGQDTSRFADLSHFLFGICETITLADIAEVTVVINGVPQHVILGDNVEIRTEDHPDPPTGCVGLKFDFPLNKVNGVMEVCITLNSVFAVGPMNVCLFGGNTTATGLSICGPVCGGGETGCEKTFFQVENVCVPVTITPFATPGEATATCCGETIVNQNTTQCPGTRTSCTFTVTQRLCIEIPITFGAVIETGEARVQCGEVTTTPCDCSTAVSGVADGTCPLDESRRNGRFFNR